ncbi:MAG: glycoside hydrolase [Thermoplasmata archaeon]|nr:glycoside hydrolase [Thermoplasmata archaeon]
MRLVVGVSSLFVAAAVLIMSSGTSLAEVEGDWSDPVAVSDSIWRIVSSGDLVVAHGIDAMVVSEDGGDTWGGEMPVDGVVDIADGILYRANITGFPDYGDTVYFSKSDDTGETWSPAAGVITLEGWNDLAFGVYSLGSVLVMYSYDSAGTDEGRIVASRSTDGGDTWSDQAVVDPYVHVEDPMPADLVLWNDKVYLAYWNYSYDDEEFYDVMLAESGDMGETWTSGRVVAEGVSPCMAADGDSLYMTYLGIDGSNGTGIYFIESSDGIAWSAPLLVGGISEISDYALLHSLAVRGQDLFVGYTDAVDTGDWFVYTAHVNHSSDWGATWSDMGDIMDGDAHEGILWMDASGGRLHAITAVFDGWLVESVMYTHISISSDDDGREVLVAVAAAAACVAFAAVALMLRKKRRG